MKKSLLSGMGLLAVLGLGLQANAGQIAGTGLAFSEPELAGASVVNFDTATPGTYWTNTFGPVTISSQGNMPYRISTDYSGSYNNPGIALENGTYDSGFTTNVLFQFANPVSAFAFSWGASDMAAGLTVYSDAAGTSAIESMALPQVGASNAGDYFGLYAASSTINSARITFDASDWCFVDELHLTENAVVPTPAAGVAGLALLSALGLRRRRTA